MAKMKIDDEMIMIVDEDDNTVGYEHKTIVHKSGILHRAFSIFIFNSKSELLIQKRAYTKYHSAGLWTNACCSHQRFAESLLVAVHRRLIEEMGFDCHLEELFKFKYNIHFDDCNLQENEYDYVFYGIYDGLINPNTQEVDDYKWVNIEDLLRNISIEPEKYTYWFKLAINKVVDIFNSKHSCCCFSFLELFL
jgi:isopentenyl-diphosphate delta-isomerase